MEDICNRFNSYGEFNGASDGWVNVYYNAGVPTAQAGWNGDMVFGGTWPGLRVSMHELNHWLGSVYGHNMNGPWAVTILEQFDGIGARFGTDGTHFWPYGMNYDNEWSDLNAQRNVAIMYAQRRDWGITTGDPWAWAATNVTLTASDAVWESGFNHYSKWSDNTFAHPNAAYSTGAFSIRTPQGNPSWKFAGASLTVNTGGQLLYNSWGTAGVITINGLTLDGGAIKHEQNPLDLFQLAGSMTLAAGGGTVDAANGDIKIHAPIGGTGSLTKTGGYTTTLTSINTYTGGTIVNAGTLALANGGTSGAIRGTLTINSGSVKLNATDALGWGNNTSVTQLTINGATLDNAVSGNNGLLASWTLNGGTMTSTGGGAFHINAGAGKTISSLASSTPSVINANIAIRGPNSTLPISVADGAATTDLWIIGGLRNSPYEAGANGIQKTGAGTLVLSGVSNYTGATNVTGGTLGYIGAPSNVGSVSVANGAALRVQAVAGAAALTATSVTLAAGSQLTLDLASLDATAPLISAGAFTASGTVGLTLQNGGALSSGTHKLVGYSSFAGGGTFSGTTITLGPRSTGTLANNGTNALNLIVNANRPVWSAGSGTWSGAGSNWKLQNGGTTTTYLEGDNVLFNDTAAGTAGSTITITLGSAISPAGTTFDNSSKNYTLSGGFGISGAGGLIKSGTGTLTLATPNTFTGNVTVNGGTLAAAYGLNDLTINGRAWGSFGNGQTVGKTVTINNGATVSFTGGNVLGGGASTLAQAPLMSFVVNQGGLLKTATGNVGGTGGGDANIFGALTLNGGTFTTGNGYSADWQSAIFLKTVTVRGNSASTINSNATNTIANGIMLGDSASGIDVIGFDVADATGDATADLIISARLTNSANSTSNAASIGALSKLGAGTMVLSGSNSYTGGTMIGEGTIVISTDNNLGGEGSPVTLDGGTLTTTNTVALTNTHPFTIGASGGVLNIAGSGAETTNQGDRMVFPTANTLIGSGPLTITGGGTLAGAAPNSTTAGAGVVVLAASNTYSGNLTLQNGGLLENAAAGSLGSGATITLGNEGELTVGNGNTLSNGITVSGGTNSVLSFTNAASTFSGAITANANLIIGLRNWYNHAQPASGTISGVISGAGGLTVNSGMSTGGTLTLTGLNTFTGTVTVDGGTLYANPGNAAANRAFSYVNGITVNSGGTLRAGLNGLFGWDGTQTKPITVNTGGTLTTDAANTDVNVGIVTLNGGTLDGSTSTAWGSWSFKRVAGGKIVATDNSTVSAPNVSIGTGNTVEVAAGKTLTWSGAITDLTSEGVCALVKSNGTGTLKLTAANTYTGTTAINAGTLELTGSLAAGSAVRIASGATLTGPGTVGGALTFAANAIHAPGPGTQAVGGTLNYGAGSRVKFTLASNSNAGGAANRVAVNGALTVTAGAVIDLTFNGAGSSVDFYNAFWTQPRTWPVVTSNGRTGSFALGTISNDSSGKAASSYGSFSLTHSATGATLAWSPKPFAAWRGSNFGANAGETGSSDLLANPDGDALENVREYFHDLNPTEGTVDPVQNRIIDGRFAITFPRNTAATDLRATVRGANAPGGPWTDLARSTGGEPFTALVPGVTVAETGSGAVRNVEVRDVYLTSDPAHPARFLRLFIEAQ